MTQKERYQNQDKQTSTFLLNQEHVDLFKEIFEVMDRNNDLILPRQAFIKRLRSDPRVAKILQLPAVYLPSIDKTLPLERVFQQIIQDMYQGDADHEKSAAFISWNQFIGGFNKHKGPDEKIKLMKVKLDFNNRSDDQDKVVLDLNTIKMFEEVYATLNQEDGYVKVIDFLEAIRAHDSYREVSIQLGRTKAEKYDLQKEQVQEVLNRIEWEADEYIDLEEFMDFFSKRGRPKHFMQKEEKQRLQRTIMNKAPATEKLEKQFEKQIEINNESQEIQIDGYDSDPEYRNQKMQFMKKSNSNSKLGSPKGQEILKHLLSPKSPKNTLPRSKSAYQVGDQMSYKDYAQRQRQSSREQLGYTIPEPFRFDSRERSRPKSIRERKVEEMVQQYNQKKYSKSSFQANEVPKSVKMPLYKELTRQQEERRKENKQNSIAMTLQNERPFSFYERDQYKKVQKKTKSERDNYQFKAKSVPWYCSVQLFDNMKQQEEIQRRERVASYAQLSLTMSKLPPRMEKYELIKKSIKIKEGSKQKVEEKTMKSFQSKSIPNFAKLQETFQKLMDKKKDSQKMTTFVPFNFTAPRPKPSQFDHDQVYKQPTDFKLKQKQLEKLKQPPTIQPSTTKKQEAQIEHRRQQEEEKRQKLQQKEKEDQERIEKQNKFKSRVQRSEFLIDNSRALEEKKQQKLKNFKDERQQNEKNWSQTLEQINKNLESRPLLFEQVDNNRNNEINQIRKVLTFVKVLKSSGVKDIKKMLTPDEKDLYDKFNILSKHGFAKEFADLVEQPQKKKPKSPQKNKSQLVQA